MLRAGLQDLAADRRGGDALEAAVEQRHAEEVLQLLDLGRQRRLGDEAGFGGAAEMAGIGERNEIFQLL